MPRKKLVRSNVLPYHIYARSNNRDWFYLPTEDLWPIFIDQLFNVTIAYGLRVHAFTLMNNHYHLLASTPFANLGENMNYFNREVSREINRRTNRSNHVFGGPYKESLIEDSNYYFNAFRYVYQNPIRAGLSFTVESYPYSTISVLSGGYARAFPLHQSIFDYKSPIMNEPERALLWLNKLPSAANIEATRLGLQKTTFNAPIDRNTRSAFEFFSADEKDELDALLNHK